MNRADDVQRRHQKGKRWAGLSVAAAGPARLGPSRFICRLNAGASGLADRAFPVGTPPVGRRCRRRLRVDE